MTKKVNFLGVLFFLSFLGLNAQTPYSYYYRGQKTDLTVDRNQVYVIADTQFFNSSHSSQLFERLGLERCRNTQNSGMVKLKFNTAQTLSVYESIVDSLRQSGHIQYVLPFFENGNDEPIGTSEYFYVKLKNAGDTVLLRTITAQQHVQRVRPFSATSLWHILSIRNSAFANSLEASN